MDEIFGGSPGRDREPSRLLCNFGKCRWITVINASFLASFLLSFVIYQLESSSVLHFQRRAQREKEALIQPFDLGMIKS